MALTFSKLFCPDFIEVDGLVLLAEHYNHDNLEDWKITLVVDLSQVESVINHMHTYDLFLNDLQEDIEQSVYCIIGQAMYRCWKCSLADKYPDKRFQMFYSDEDMDEGSVISFNQIRAM